MSMLHALFSKWKKPVINVTHQSLRRKMICWCRPNCPISTRLSLKCWYADSALTSNLSTLSLDSSSYQLTHTVRELFAVISTCRPSLGFNADSSRHFTLQSAHRDKDTQTDKLTDATDCPTYTMATAGMADNYNYYGQCLFTGLLYINNLHVKSSNHCINTGTELLILSVS